jgi:hypothetical protein
MADPVTGAIFGGTQLVGGLLGAKGARKAADAQSDAAQAGIDFQRETRDMATQNLSPFMKAGQAGLDQFVNTATTELDPNKFYNDYFQSNEYAQLSDQARRNMLAGSEATGGLRSTSTANLLGSIAPQLAGSAFARQQALQDANYNRQLGLVNVGLSGAGGVNAAAGNAANNITGLMQQQGAARAGGAAAPYQMLSQLVTQAGGAYLGGQSGTGALNGMRGIF